ncbi:MAG: TraX family protein [Eubacteriales bacterium]
MSGDNRNDILKLVAAISMLLDHLGAVFFQHYIIFRIIGRIAFPIFAYYIASGFRQTSNYKKYIIRMIFFTFLTQIPFSFFAYILVGNVLYFNVLFTFVLALLVLYMFHKRQYLISAIIVILPTLMEIYTPIETDYGTYGILMVLIFYLFKGNVQNIAVLLLTIGYSSVLGVPFYNNMQIYCILALPFIEYMDKPYIKLPRYFFYIFYPLHITGLVLLYYCLL